MTRMDFPKKKKTKTFGQFHHIHARMHVTKVFGENVNPSTEDERYFRV